MSSKYYKTEYYTEGSSAKKVEYQVEVPARKQRQVVRKANAIRQRAFSLSYASVLSISTVILLACCIGMFGNL